MEVLLSQHPDTRIPNLEDPNCIAFEQYNEVPVAMPMDCTPEDLETLALRMSGSAGPSSFDAVMLMNDELPASVQQSLGRIEAGDGQLGGVAQQ